MVASERPLWAREAWELADAVRSGELKAVDVLEVFLDRIERLDPALCAFCFVDSDGARRRAEEVDRMVADGHDPGPFAGLPYAVKDTQPVAGMPWTEGSLVYVDRVADHDAVSVARMRDAGAVIVGKTTAPEFGSLNYTRTKVHGVTRNPWNPERTPGGSSGGSASAVSAGMVPLASGGDGGGSIRIPSAFCGLYGFKGSQGRIPQGPDPFDSSLTTQLGPMARSVRDAARAVDVMCGPYGTDPASLPKPATPFEEVAVHGDPASFLRGRRAVWSATLGHAVCDPEVEELVHSAALRLCDAAGIELVELDVVVPRLGVAWGVVSSLDMAAWHLEDVEDRLDDVTPFARTGFELVRDLDPRHLLTAFRRRHEVLEAYARIFDQVDLLLTPTTAIVAFEAEGPPPTEIAGRETGFTGSVPYTMLANIAGSPACSIPAGSVDGLPVGLQVCARRHEDALCVAAGALMEATFPWPQLAPVP